VARSLLRFYDVATSRWIRFNNALEDRGRQTLCSTNRICYYYTAHTAVCLLCFQKCFLLHLSFPLQSYRWGHAIRRCRDDAVRHHPPLLMWVLPSSVVIVWANIPWMITTGDGWENGPADAVGNHKNPFFNIFLLRRPPPRILRLEHADAGGMERRGIGSPVRCGRRRCDEE
jgi:hypothetical protein